MTVSSAKLFEQKIAELGLPMQLRWTVVLMELNCVYDT